MNVRLVILFLLNLTVSFTLFSKSITKVSGIAPHAIGKEVTVSAISDYLTMQTEELAHGKVKEDSTFSLSFYNLSTQKLRVQVGKDYFYIYGAPNTSYNLFVEEQSRYNAKRPEGGEVGFYFLDLEKDDINYKILLFEETQLNFLTKHYTKDERESEGFVKSLEVYKSEVQENYEADTCSFFKTYVQFAVASLDNLAFVGNRNRYEKFDFFLKFSPVFYENDRYMEYVLNYFDNYVTQLSPKVNESFYKGVLRSSPTIIMNKLGGDYALENNLKLRELVMLKMLGDSYYTKEFPQTNILTIIDSVRTNGLFEDNREIATNLHDRLTALVKGGLMPNFSLLINGEKKGRADFEGNHVYIQFVKVDSDKALQDIHLLAALQKKYGHVVEFLTVLVVPKDSTFNEKDFISEHELNWSYTVLDDKHSFLKRCKVVTYPYYILLDTQGYVVAAPALSPRPNNEYETIERYLFSIKKVRDREQEELERIRRKGPGGN